MQKLQQRLRERRLRAAAQFSSVPTQRRNFRVGRSLMAITRVPSAPDLSVAARRAARFIPRERSRLRTMTSMLLTATVPLSKEMQTVRHSAVRFTSQAARFPQKKSECRTTRLALSAKRAAVRFMSLPRERSRSTAEFRFLKTTSTRRKPLSAARFILRER